MKNFVNLTPHDIVIFDEAGKNEIARIETSGNVARCTSLETPVDGIGLPAVKSEWGEVEGLPAPIKDTIFLVSIIIFQATDRQDVARPDTGPASVVRNDQGHILGVKRLVVK